MNMGTSDPIANQGKILKSHGIKRVNPPMIAQLTVLFCPLPINSGGQKVMFFTICLSKQIYLFCVLLG